MHIKVHPYTTKVYPHTLRGHVCVCAHTRTEKERDTLTELEDQSPHVTGVIYQTVTAIAYKQSYKKSLTFLSSIIQEIL